MGYKKPITYIAGDWDHDYDAVDQLLAWNESGRYGLTLKNAHDLTQARDTSLNCSIKRSLSFRMNYSHKFVLVVGTHTKTLRAGKCCYCYEYRVDYWQQPSCNRNYSIDNRSYVEYECEKAVRDGLDIIVLYKSVNVDKSLCPEIVRYRGIHKAMRHWVGNHLEWDYQAVKAAFDFYE